MCVTCLASKSLAHPSLLDSLGRPAVFVARDHTIVRSNASIRRFFVKLKSESDGLRIGEALDCMHASSDDRCGETARCPDCGLRRLIGLVHSSGERLRRIPIHHQRKSGLRQTFEFTAARAGEAVLLLL
jgi:hypothetical protein